MKIFCVINHLTSIKKIKQKNENSFLNSNLIGVSDSADLFVIKIVLNILKIYIILMQYLWIQIWLGDWV